jgi:hypothetical protein
LVTVTSVDLRERIAQCEVFSPSERDLLIDLVDGTRAGLKLLPPQPSVGRVRGRVTCAAEVADPEIRRVRERNGEPMECNAPAKYSIDGVALCRRHAGFTLLDLMTESR